MDYQFTNAAETEIRDLDNPDGPTIVVGSPGYNRLMNPEEGEAPTIAAFVTPPPANNDVDRERDSRTASLSFDSVDYQCDERSQQNIAAMGTDARFAVLNGAVADDLRWANPDADFGWIAADNSVTPMDAQTMAAFADAAKLWVMSHIFAARALKDADPIPADYTSNVYWPAT